MKFKKSIIRLVVFSMILLSLWLTYAHRRRAQRELAACVLRFHVTAQSDDQADQSKKLLVRDAVLNYMEKYMENVSSKEEAMCVIENHLDDIRMTAKNTLLSESDSHTVSVSLGKAWFPDRTYGNVLFPEGYYDSLNIRIGSGEGHNWWCVMFPRLCFLDASTASFEESSKNILSGSLSADTYNSLCQETQSETRLRFKYLTFLNFLFD